MASSVRSGHRATSPGNGGLLSHAAIVSREYGIPGVVGTREATEHITDGVLVRVDQGDLAVEGTVEDASDRDRGLPREPVRAASG